MNPFFSPDGKWLGFVVPGQVKKVPTAGGTASPIYGGDLSGASWGPDNTILIGGVYAGILRVSADGGNPTVLVPPTSSIGYTHPQFLPGGREFMYARGRPFENNELVIRSLDKADDKVVLSAGYDFQYLNSGYIVYSKSSGSLQVDLFAVSYDVAKREVVGEPVVVVKGVRLSSSGGTGQFSVSHQGTLGYFPANPDDIAGSKLVAVDRQGKISPLATELREYSDPRVSPDGRYVALHVTSDQNDIWVADVTRGTLTRLSYNAGEDETPAWWPDGRTVVWASSRTDLTRGIFRRAADASGNEELIWKLDQHCHVRDWTPDGRSLVIEIVTGTGTNIWRLDLQPEPKLLRSLKHNFTSAIRVFRLMANGWHTFRMSQVATKFTYRRFPKAEQRPRFPLTVVTRSFGRAMAEH